MIEKYTRMEKQRCFIKNSSIYFIFLVSVLCLVVVPAFGDECPPPQQFEKAVKLGVFQFLSNPQRSVLNMSELNAGVELYLSSGGSYAEDYCNQPIPNHPDVNLSKVISKSEQISSFIIPKCADGTEVGECSSSKPLYCRSGDLVDDCFRCGCSDGYCITLNGCCSTGCVAEYPECLEGYNRKQCRCGTDVYYQGYCCNGFWRWDTPCENIECFSDAGCQALHPSKLLGYECFEEQLNEVWQTSSCNVLLGYCSPNMDYNPISYCYSEAHCQPNYPVCMFNDNNVVSSFNISIYEVGEDSYIVNVSVLVNQSYPPYRNITSITIIERDEYEVLGTYTKNCMHKPSCIFETEILNKSMDNRHFYNYNAFITDELQRNVTLYKNATYTK
ncbi:MAG: hypothetical protein QXK37_04810 [Candidatus Woesearchaeota archaeon]